MNDDRLSERADGKTDADDRLESLADMQYKAIVAASAHIVRLETDLAAKEDARAQWAETAYRLREALDRYGQHAENCHVNRLRTNEPAHARQCNCGLDAALGEPASATGEPT